jgi:hypothetical protein
MQQKDFFLLHADAAERANKGAKKEGDYDEKNWGFSALSSDFSH